MRPDYSSTVEWGTTIGIPQSLKRDIYRNFWRTSENAPSTHSGEYCPQTDYDSYHAIASKAKEASAMIERTNAPGLSQPPGYSHVVVASGRRLVTTAGAVPLDAEGNLVGQGDLLVQARKTLENLALTLEAVGARGRDVIKMTVYVVTAERADLGAVWGAVGESGIAGAASTLLGVSMLAIEGQLVKIEAIAVLE
jgi:enamine deaminase RidA (YjgF/YER057c/UK114 family)